LDADFTLQNSCEGVAYRLVLPNDAARNEIFASGRFVHSKTEKDIFFGVFDDDVDRDQWGMADYVSKVVVAEETRFGHGRLVNQGMFTRNLRHSRPIWDSTQVDSFAARDMFQLCRPGADHAPC
jgi:hypothetical protein